jgi:very-short-patch-repair endonuclease
MDCTIEKSQGGNDREAQMQMLLEQYDKNSATELKFLRYLHDNCLALPDRAQVNVPEFYISADFVYDTPAGPVLVFCDGSIHDHQLVQEDDAHKRGHLRNRGYDVIEWHYSKPLEALVAERRDVFRKVC